ncbi:MAG TPA: hypothetical protein QGI27_03525 [Flavobacteriaceae bacterium]|nr:hypothetical protein [Flavobacteriaceae bacterium]
MIKKINLTIAVLYSIILSVTEVALNWGDWQYAPLWIVDYLIVLILLSAVFIFKDKIQKYLLLTGWSFSAGVMYMVLFINLEPKTTLTVLDNYILSGVGVALIFSLIGILLSFDD